MRFRILLACFIGFQIFALRGQTYVQVLGTVQDAGAPHIGCLKPCCENRFENHSSSWLVSSLGIIDQGRAYVIDATPDFTLQLKNLFDGAGFLDKRQPDGIFLTHAHIGHYTGLMYLGREALGAKDVPVYTMPRFKTFLESNGPWSQLVSLSNIRLQTMQNEKWLNVSDNIKIQPILVPHRDEYSETVGFLIEGPEKKMLFIPDIDKWSTWKYSINDFIEQVDYALIDATFFSAAEVSGRSISEIPHPLVEESIHLFQSLSKADKSKIYFIHMNHTNPMLDVGSSTYDYVYKKGFNIATLNQKLDL